MKSFHWHRWVPLLLCCLAVSAAGAAEIRGTVFRDANANGVRDADEPGIAGVMVSDGRAVADTGADGSYRLESAENPALIWISLPRDYRSGGSFFQECDGTRAADFPITPSPQADDLLFVQMSDSHIGRGDLLQQFCRRLNDFPVPLAFVVNTGDLVGGSDTLLPEQAPTQYDAYRQSIEPLKLPLFNLPGNHEHAGITNKQSDRNHPNYGKGLYRKTFGPTYYSWDWGRVHFIALDGTRLPYAEALGAEQRAWLAEDLKRQPAAKPIILFCHQSLPSLRDAKELAALLAGHRVLAGICGHLHNTFETKLGDFPVYQTGALSGSWWSGPNPDGSPQGFRLVSVQGDTLTTTYSGREGPWSLNITSPKGAAIQKGVVPIEATVLDFGKDVRVRGRFAGQDVPLLRVDRARFWSTWKGEMDTAAVPDGLAELILAAAGEGGENPGSMRFIALNGKEAPAATPVDSVVKMQVRGVDAADLVEFNGTMIGALTPKVANDTWAEFPVPRALLRRLNVLTVKAVVESGQNKDDFSVGPVRLEMNGKPIFDLRSESFRRYNVGDGKPAAFGETLQLYFCLP